MDILCPCALAGVTESVVLDHLSIFLLVSRVIDPENPTHERGPAEVVHGQVGAALILVFEEGEATRLACLFVAHEVDMYRLPELRENGDDVALGEVKGKASNVNICGVSVVSVPRRFWRAITLLSAVRSGKGFLQSVLTFRSPIHAC